MAENILIVSFSFEQEPEAFETVAKAGFTPVLIPEHERKGWKQQDFINYIDKMTTKPIGLILGADFNITAEFLNKCPTIKFISLNCAGYDHVDLSACKTANVLVTNVPRQNFDAVADFAWGQIISLMRRISEGDKAIRRGEWTKGVERGYAVSQKKLGIIGFGAIGQGVHKRSKGFDMDVCIHSRTIKPELEQKLGIKYEPLETVLQTSDIIVLTCPCTDENYHMINAKTIDMMKTTAVLINPSRGGLINTNDLYDSLKNKRIRGAAIDAYEEEPLLSSPLFELDNVLLTPHLGGLADREIHNVAMLSAENLVGLIKEKTSKYLIETE